MGKMLAERAEADRPAPGSARILGELPGLRQDAPATQVVNVSEMLEKRRFRPSPSRGIALA
jgi:hypothetical protein